MKRPLALLGVVLLALFSSQAVGQLSANSGINTADTYVALDVTISGNTAFNLPNPVYNPATGTNLSVLTVAPTTPTFHLEAGYDANGALLMNLWPTGPAPNPLTSGADAIGFLRFGGGQITVFDQKGNPLPISLPSGVPTAWPLNLLGTNPGPSVISNLVVSNIQTFANSIHANLVMTSNPTAALVSPTPNQSSHATWTYVQSGANWIAQQIVLTPSIANATSTHTIQFSNLVWHDNASADSARTARGYTAISPPVPNTGDPTGFSAQTPPATGTSITQLGGPQNVAFMHGFKSDAGTWARMTGWLNQDFRFGAQLVPTYPWSNRLATQGTSLLSSINSAGGTNYILIGHSQGGLVSRSAAQQFQASNNTTSVRGVISIDTPHHGAPIAITGGPTILVGLEFFGRYLWNVTGCSNANDNFVCYLAAVIFFGAPVVADVWFSSNPDIQDLIPGSAFLNQLNAFSESFARSGIVSSTPLRWSEARILDNALFGSLGCANPDSACGERNFATATEITHDTMVALFFFCILQEIFDPENADYWADEAFFFFRIFVGMDAVDLYWNTIVSGVTSSDGLVPASSQNYPVSGTTQYGISGADSHTGATRSTYVRNTLDQVLQQQFQVPTQASCTFSLSPGSLSISPAGGSSSFSLVTSAGCTWSAVSEAPWITLTSGISGNSSATIGFAVAANPTTIPRSGVIKVGNKSFMASFFITEVGVCTYVVSPDLVVFAPGGGTSSVNVNTQVGCVWSAVSSAAWLTVPSGASGTSSGSFTIQAAPGNNNASFSGTVTVMNQVVNVVVGSAIGTPGTGTLTIAGHARTGYSCPSGCRLKSCCSMIWENGSVSVNVGGILMSANYGGSTPTTSTVATALATKINGTAASPVIATVSGAVVTLVSKVNGVVTNYSVTTSYSYNTTDFDSPAFTATASGAQLSGGTD